MLLVLTSTGIPSLTLVSGFSVSVTFQQTPLPYTSVSNTIAIKINFHYNVVFIRQVNSHQHV
jgi:hypothetical protein